MTRSNPSPDTFHDAFQLPLDKCAATADRFRVEANSLRAKCSAILDTARTQNRSLTPEEETELERTFNDIDKLNRQVQTLESGIIDHALGGRSRPMQWMDKDGKPVFVLAKGDRWQDLPRRSDIDPSASVGELIRCAITGDWRNASPAIRMAQTEGSDSGGGFLVPDELMRGVIDLARARSFVMQAGAQTVPMTTDRLTLAKVTADPTFETKNENSAFTGSDITFGQLGFTAHTVGTLITCSRELAEDAPNFQQIVEQTLANAFSAKLDNIAVNGVSSSHLDGILDWDTASGISETDSVAGIAWEDLATAVVDIQTSDIQPNAYCVHPEIAGDLAALTSGDGTNSAKLWLGPPPNVAPLAQYVTTHIANTSIIVGDWTQFLWAIRQGARIEVSREAGDSFAKHQVLIKLTWRGDTGAFRRDAFHRLVGITS